MTVSYVCDISIGDIHTEMIKSEKAKASKTYNLLLLHIYYFIQRTEDLHSRMSGINICAISHLVEYATSRHIRKLSLGMKGTKKRYLILQ